MYKSLKRNLVLLIGVLLSSISYVFCCLNFKEVNKIVIFDIDNTLALSDPFIYKKKFTISNVPVNNSILKILIEEKNKNSKIIFLSHRPFFQYYSSYKWIKKNVINEVSYLDLILVPFVSNKIAFIKLFMKKGKVSYYDDLHYGFELEGGPFPYNKIINKIKTLKIKYYNYNYIKNHE